MACRDKCGHLLPLSETQCLSIETVAVSPSSSKDNQVKWHAETNLVICSLCCNVFRPRLLRSPFCHPETIKSDGTQRQIWSSAPFVNDSMSFDRDFCGLPFFIQRQSSLMARRDKYGHLLPLSKTQCLSTETVAVSPLSYRDNQVQWHAKTNMVLCSLFRRLNVFRSTLFQSPLHHPDTIKSDGLRR